MAFVKNVLKPSIKLANTRSLSYSGFMGNKNQSNKLHLAVQREYPPTEQLPLPPNIDSAESTRFSPLRNRDITSSAISAHHEMNGIDITSTQAAFVEAQEVRTEPVTFNDPHLGSYDRQTAVNLSSVMQSTVPQPFGGNNNLSHLNMPGGSWGQQTKYLSHELNSSHYTQLRQEFRQDWNAWKEEEAKGNNQSSIIIAKLIHNSSLYNCSLLNPKCLFQNKLAIINNKRFISSSSKEVKSENKPQGQSETDVSEAAQTKVLEKETGRSKLKQAVKDYGSTVIVFHVGISLMSLGLSFLLVSSGLDVMAFLEWLTLAERFPKIAENASTFVIAYALHKIFAPVRISITLASVPFIVRFLRRRGFLKK